MKQVWGVLIRLLGGGLGGSSVECQEAVLKELVKGGAFVLED